LETRRIFSAALVSAPIEIPNPDFSMCTDQFDKKVQHYSRSQDIRCTVLPSGSSPVTFECSSAQEKQPTRYRGEHKIYEIVMDQIFSKLIGTSWPFVSLISQGEMVLNSADIVLDLV